MRKAQALKQARRYPVPTEPGVFVRIPSVEVYCAWMELHSLQHIGWKGGMAVVRKNEKMNTDRTKP